MYILEVYLNLPGIGWTGVDSYKLGTERHTALTSPRIYRAVESVCSRYTFPKYFAIKYTPSEA